jgi:hypothetical protein
MSARGYWLTDQNGDRRWYSHPEVSRCGGKGWIRCHCGGDLCVCGNQGEIECYGCPDCDQDDDECYPEDDDEPLPAPQRDEAER